MNDGRRLRPVPSPVALALVVVGLAIPLIVAVIALSGRRWYPVLDLAMTEFRIRDVGSRQTPLIGLPGRIGELPDQGSHPGPLSFWLLTPGYRLFGSSAWAMEAATVTVQLVWISLAVWIGKRRLDWVGVAMVAAVIAVLIRGYGLTTLVQPWNPFLPLLAWLVILLATWSVFVGDHAMLVPLVLAASYSAQTHIPYLLMAGGLGVASAAVVAARWWRDRSATVDGERVRPPAALLVTVGAFAVLWLAPLVDQIRRDPGNIRRLLDHFGSPTEDPIGFGAGFRLLLRHLDVVGGFAELLTGRERFLQGGFDPDGAIWPGMIVLVVWIGSVVVARRLAHRDLLALHAVIGLTLALSFVSMARIFGLRWYYLTLWAWTTTTVLFVAIVWTAVAWWRVHRRDRAGWFTAPRLVAAGTTIAAIATVSMTVAAPSTDHPEEYLGETVGELLGPTEAALRDGVGAAVGPDGVYVVVWDDAYFFGSQAFALINELERSGLDARAYDFWSVPVTSERTAALGEPSAEVVFATGGFVDRWRADDRVVEVAAVEPRTPDEVAEFDRLRSELIASLEASGLDDLVDSVDTNLFGLRIDERLDDAQRAVSGRMIRLGQETAVFIGPPGVLG